MKWPPNKAWTSTFKRGGYRHFVAINYGGKSKDRWVNLVSVIDGNVRIKVSWKEIRDTSQWISGWEQLSREESMSNDINLETFNQHNSIEDEPCLHPSEDSGLVIPSDLVEIRPWFDNK